MRINWVQSISLSLIVLVVLIPGFSRAYRISDDDESENASDASDVVVADEKKLQTALKIVKSYLEYQIEEINSIINKKGLRLEKNWSIDKLNSLFLSFRKQDFAFVGR